MLLMWIFWILGVGAVVHGVSLWSTAGAWVAFGAALIGMAFWPIVRSR